MKRADIESTNYGTIISIAPATARGRQWMRRNVPDSQQTPSYAVDCDHRYGIDILEGALAAGLTLLDTASGRTAKGRHDD